MECLSDNEIAGLLEGQLSPHDHARALSHLDGCDTCRALVGQLGDDDAGPLAPGSLLGRYVILGVLGAGAMGVVYSAHDPSLDRKIALKLLRTDAGEAREQLSARLLREARALARLAHPNVVAVHDVGAHGNEVFLAMELVEGGTLRRWLSAEKRGWRAVLRLFMQAGEGLASAHEQGIVHRDFKPDNVLVGGDGRVRVTDFGLARGSIEAGPDEQPTGGIAGAPLITRTGALAGTPAYMAPEQLAGLPATALSDQYGFCVSLHEALWGTRPTSRETSFPESAGLSGVPATLKKIIARGLLASPEARWPDMRALLDQLGRVEKRSSPFGLAAIALLSLSLVAALMLWLRPPAARPCAAPFDAPSEGWDAAAQARVRQALASLGDEGARLFAELDPRLRRRASDIGQMRREACEALHVRKEISTTQFDQRDLCLNRRRGELASLVRLLAQGDRALLGDALLIASSLPDTAACRQFEALSRRPPLPTDPARRAQIRALDERLTQAETWALLLQQLPEADTVAREVLAQATSMNWTPLVTRALLTLSKTEHALRTPQQAVVFASEAAAAALAANDDEVLADAWLVRIDIAGHAGHLDAAEDCGRLAKGAISRLGGDPIREAARLGSLCRAHERAGTNLELSRSLCQEARDLLMKERPDELFLLATTEERLGNVLFKQEHYREAEQMYRSAIDKRQSLLPVDSPLLVNSRGNLAEALILQGRPKEALELFDALVRVVTWWHLYDGQALALWKLGERTRAVAAQRRALEVCAEKAPDELCGALASIRLAEFLIEMGAVDEARSLLDRALALREKGVKISPIDEARAHLRLAALETSTARATLLRQRAAALLEPVAHWGGSYRELLDAARSGSAQLPPL